MVFSYLTPAMPSDNSHDLAGWVESYTSDLFTWALHKTSDEELARDLVQDTFMAAAEKLDGFREDSSPKTFLFSILNHKIIDHYRRKVNKPVKLDEEKLSNVFNADGEWLGSSKPQEWKEDETNLLDDDDFQSVLRKCIGNLPDNWNACITLKYLQEKKTEEICQDLGITTSNYWQMMHRVKLQLRECIENIWFKL